MAVGSPPTVRRRQLGRELRRLREEAGLHADQLAERLRCSPSRVSRIETARIRIAPGAVHEFLDALDIHDDRRDRLVALARQAEEPGWWQEYGGVLTYEHSTFIAMEAEAAVIRSYQPLVVPGLLQTPEYARAVFAKGIAGQDLDVEDRVSARIARQAVLAREPPLRLWVLLGEAALRRPVGGVVAMRYQLRHLVDTADRGHIRVQVVPFAAGELASMHGPFMIVEFPDPEDPPVVYVENMAGDAYLENPQRVAECGAIFDGLAADALSEAQSASMIKTIASNL